jgi:hypothetical protein
MRPLTAIGLVALAAANAALIALVTVELLQDPDETPGAPESTPALTMGESGIPQPRPIGDYAQTLARPVFLKSRAPFVAPPPAPPPVVKPPAPPVSADPGLALAGVMIRPGQRKAYLVSKADSRGTWASEGDILSGWKVQLIAAGGVKLQQQDRTVELPLYPP